MSLKITSDSFGPSGMTALRVQFSAELGSALGWRPNLNQVRAVLGQAQQAGIEPRLLYEQAAMARPLDWPPAPSYDQVMSPESPIMNPPNVLQPKEGPAEFDDPQSLDIVQSDERQDEEKLLVQDIITLGRHCYAQGFRDFDGWKNHMLDQLGSSQMLPYVVRVWPEVSGEPAPVGDQQRGPTVREPMAGASRESTSAKHHTPYRAVCRRCHAEFSFPGGTTGSYCAMCQEELFGAVPRGTRGWKPVLIPVDKWGRWIRHFERVDDPRTACGRWNVDVDSIPDSPGVRGEIIICRSCLLAIEAGA